MGGAGDGADGPMKLELLRLLRRSCEAGGDRCV